MYGRRMRLWSTWVGGGMDGGSDDGVCLRRCLTVCVWRVWRGQTLWRGIDVNAAGGCDFVCLQCLSVLVSGHLMR